MKKKVIIDLGVHRGEDSNFYLKKGFRVIGVEASDELVEILQQKFKEQINGNDFKILHYAITGEDNQTVTFYQNTGNSVWGTIFEDWDDRNKKLGTSSVLKTVKSIRLNTLIQQELATDETLEYVKIDIEGADMIALKSLQDSEYRPKYLSWES